LTAWFDHFYCAASVGERCAPLLHPYTSPDSLIFSSS